jgi:hypothetical protein
MFRSIHKPLLVFVVAAVAAIAAVAVTSSDALAPGPEANDGSIVVAGAGDIATCLKPYDKETAALLAAVKPAAVFTLGDNAYPSGSSHDFARCYGPSWGRFLDITRPVPGNHEYMQLGAAPYYGYFGSRAGDPGQGWYAYDLGSWRLYALNSNCADVGGCDVGSPQEKWLRADLAAHPRTCALAMWHHPRWSSGEHGNLDKTDALWRDLAVAGVEVVLVGHDHDYERLAPLDGDGHPAPSGMVEFVVGTGGATLRGFHDVLPFSVTRAEVHGILQLRLAPTSYSWQFIPVTGEGSYGDSGTVGCH